MLQITPHHTIVFSINYVDFRKGIDGLCAICRDHLKSDPIEGAADIPHELRVNFLFVKFLNEKIFLPKILQHFHFKIA